MPPMAKPNPNKIPPRNNIKFFTFTKSPPRFGE
jgi:hypothetical protein